LFPATAGPTLKIGCVLTEGFITEHSIGLRRCSPENEGLIIDKISKHSPKLSELS
jgi:hypothetical protein